MEKEVKASININAKTSKVWDALTKSEYTKQYMFGCEAITDWKPGSSLDWKGQLEGKDMVFVTGKIVKIEPAKFLEYTIFDPNSNLKNIPSNHLHVTYNLSRENGHTVLNVTTGDFTKVEEGERRYNDTISGGGWASVLEGIKKLAEQ